MGSAAVSLTSVLRDGRAAFERRMRATCLIRRVAGSTLDEWGAEVPAYTTVYEGKCYTRYPGMAFEQNPEAGGFSLTVSRVVLRIPFGPVVKPGDVVAITADPDNPQMIGSRLRVASSDDQSQATAQRILCEDFQNGGG